MFWDSIIVCISICASAPKPPSMTRLFNMFILFAHSSFVDLEFILSVSNCNIAFIMSRTGVFLILPLVISLNVNFSKSWFEFIWITVAAK